MISEEEIRKRLRQLRVSNGESESCAGKLLGLERGAYAKLENGPTRLLSKHLPTLAEHYGVTLEYLIEGQDDSNPSASLLMDQESNTERIKELTDQYEERIEKLNEELNLQKELVSAHVHTISVLEQLLSRYRKQEEGD